MACGTPVIATARGSMPEIVRDGTNGCLVASIAEAVEAVEAVGTLDRHAVRASVERRFDVDRMVDEYLDVYREILWRSRMTASDGSKTVVPAAALDGRGGSAAARPSRRDRAAPPRSCR